MQLDEMGIDDVIALFHKKNQYQKEENLLELIQLKKSHPDLFNPEKEIELTELLDTINFIKETPYFKAAFVTEQKKKYVTIDYQNWKEGSLEKFLTQYSSIDINDISAVAREMVKEVIIGCKTILEHHKKELILIQSVFPYLGGLLSEIICKLPIDKRQHIAKLAVIKLGGQEWKATERIIYNKLMENSLNNYFNSIVKQVTQKFDQRNNFYSDRVFFCAMEAAEFIGLLIPHIGGGKNFEVKDVINSINNNIHIT